MYISIQLCYIQRHEVYTTSLTVPYRSYKFSIYAATVVGEGPQYDDEFLTREDGK